MNVPNLAAIVAIVLAAGSFAALTWEYNNIKDQNKRLLKENEELSNAERNVECPDMPSEVIASKTSGALQCEDDLAMNVKELQEAKSSKNFLKTQVDSLALENNKLKLELDEIEKSAKESEAQLKRFASTKQNLGGAEYFSCAREKRAIVEDRESRVRGEECRQSLSGKVFVEPNRIISSDDVSIKIESAEISNYGQKAFVRLLVSNPGKLPVYLMYDGREGFNLTDLSGNQIELTRATGIYRCNYGLFGKQYCDNYLSSAPVVEPSSTNTISLQGEVNDKSESPITGSRFDFNGRFLILDPTKKLSVIAANIPGIPANSHN